LIEEKGRHQHLTVHAQAAGVTAQFDGIAQRQRGGGHNDLVGTYAVGQHGFQQARALSHRECRALARRTEKGHAIATCLEHALCMGQGTWGI